jgi:hypothetical protein
MPKHAAIRSKYLQGGANPHESALYDFRNKSVIAHAWLAGRCDD